jgi:carboxylesterase
MYSPEDRIDKSKNILTIVNEVSSPFLREVLIENSIATFSNDNFPLVVEESLAFINEVTSGVWLTEISPVDDDTDLIDAEFQSIIAGLSLDESSPTTYLDELERDNPEDHFEIPDPELLPIADRTKRNAIVAMLLGPVYAILAAVTGFNPLGIEPWPGILAFFGGLAVFLYRLRDDDVDDDGAVL